MSILAKLSADNIVDSNFSADIKAGLVVFLIALPLSLGIAVASGAPLTAGIISASLGGIIGSYLGGSAVTINGPAAGLIVVVLSAIQSLSYGDPLLGFKRFLACVVVVGVLQIVAGLFKTGRFAAIFPTPVVHGMLASIGLIIMMKQFHVLFGVAPDGSVLSSISKIPATLANMNTNAFAIAAVSLFILFIYPKLNFKLAKIIPAPLVVIVIAMGMAHYTVGVPHVDIPLNIKDFLVFPLFDQVTSWPSIVAIISLFFVASLESILSASAVDKLDPYQRESDFNRELWSKGVVNLLCGLIGGLPIIAEIVRSSANISQGAKTPLANFSHGVFIMVFAILFPAALNMIPLSALAAILVLVGYRLGNPKLFVAMKRLGSCSLLAFLVTIFFTLIGDLLVGILAGIIVKGIGSLMMGARPSFMPNYKLNFEGDEALLSFEHSLCFFSAVKQKEILSSLVDYKVIRMDLTKVKFIDPTSLGIFAREISKFERCGKKVEIRLPENYKTIYKNLK